MARMNLIVQSPTPRQTSTHLQLETVPTTLKCLSVIHLMSVFQSFGNATVEKTA